MFPLLCIRGGGSLTVSSHLSLQNRLLAINYINDGGDDELYIAHRYELYPSKLSLWAITKYFSSSSCCSCLLVISLSAAFMQRSWWLAQWGRSEKSCLDINWHGVQVICWSCAQVDEPSHSRHFMRGPWLYGLQPIRFESVYSQAQSSFKLVFKVVWWMCRLWGKRFNCLFPKFMSWENSKKMDRPLVIGYISPDFFTHSVSYFIEAPLVHHDYTNYQIVVYSAVVKVCYILHVFPFVPCTYELQGECYHG